jgi:hypothetical protein
MHPLEDAVDAMAQDTEFSGVVRVDRSGAWPIAGVLEELLTA